MAVFSTNGFKIEHVVIATDQLYRTIKMLGVPKVLVGRLFHRNRVLRKGGLTLAQYNARVDKINRTLEANSVSWLHILETQIQFNSNQFPNVEIMG